MAYDGLNRLITFVNERGSAIAYTYSDTDQPVATTDPNTVVTSYVRNGWSEAIQQQSNDVGAIVYERDQKGQVTERTDARGVVSQFSYDDGGRITAAIYPGETASNVTYTYDSVTGGNKGIGRLTGVTDAAGTVAYVYDILGRTIEEERVIGSQTYTTAYEYDAAGNVADITYPSGRIVFFDRDDDGRTEVIRTLPSGGSMAWLVQWVGRTPFGPRSGILFGNNMRDVRHYDPDGRITELETLIDSTSSHSIHWTNQYGDKRNLTGITDLLNARRTAKFTPPSAHAADFSLHRVKKVSLLAAKRGGIRPRS